MAEHEQNIPVENEEGAEEKAPETPLEQFFYHQRRALEETGKALEALLPPGFREHSSEASREFAKGFRVLVDAAIDELKKISEKEQQGEGEGEGEAETPTEAIKEEPRPATTGKTKVKVKVE